MNENYSKLELLKNKLLNELDCPLKDNSTNLVFGKGNPNAQIMFIGEAPGEKEDLSGVPFVGRAGKELDKLLSKINLSIDEVYIANILKYRPPKNRDPKPDEIIKHTPYLIEQIKIIKPKVISTLGNYSTKFILSNFNYNEMKKVEGIQNLHGIKHNMNINGIETIIVPLYHPAAMLYRPKLREDAEEDFKTIAKIIGKTFENQKKLL